MYNKHRIERIINYFLVQRLGSYIFLYRNFLFFYFSYYFVILALLIKLAVAPLHRWLIKVCSGLDWFSVFLLLTVQKVIPTIALFLIINYKLLSILIFFILIRSLIGCFGGLGQTSLRIILSYSSIRHIRWIISILLVSSIYWFKYFIIYSIILVRLVISVYKNKIYRLRQIFRINFSSILLFFSLGGLPPFLGFFIKVIAIIKLIDWNYYIILVILLRSSLISLFYYCRIGIFIYLNVNLNLNKSYSNKFNFFYLLNFILRPILFL